MMRPKKLSKKDQILNSKLLPLDYWRFYRRIDIDTKTQCWLWQGAKDIDGYGAFSIDHVTVKTSRFSYTIHKGRIPLGEIVCHNCDTPHCCNPDHLYIGDDAKNVADRTRRNRHQDHITDETVINIYKDSVSGKFKQKEVVAKYGVCAETIRRIVKHDRPRYAKIIEAVEVKK